MAPRKQKNDPTHNGWGRYRSQDGQHCYEVTGCSTIAAASTARSTDSVMPNSYVGELPAASIQSDAVYTPRPPSSYTSSGSGLNSRSPEPTDDPARNTTSPSLTSSADSSAVPAEFSSSTGPLTVSTLRHTCRAPECHCSDAHTALYVAGSLAVARRV